MKPPDDDKQEEADRQTRSLAGLAVVLALSFVGLALVHKLSQVSRIEDCLLEGRSNCAPINVTDLRP